MKKTGGLPILLSISQLKSIYPAAGRKEGNDLSAGRCHYAYTQF